MFCLAHLSHSFSGKPAVDDVSFGLGQGKILALLGPNGTGKTTIVNMIRDEMRSDGGRIYRGGAEITSHGQNLTRQSIGICPQFDTLDLLTARQHVEFYARPKGITEVKANAEIAPVRAELTLHTDKQ